MVALPESTYRQAFGDVLRRVRLYRHLTPDQLAADSGVPLSRILRFENGMVEPSLTELFLLGHALKARPASFVDGVEYLMGSPPARNVRVNGGGRGAAVPVLTVEAHPE